MNKKKDNSNLMMTLLKGRTLFVLIILFIFFSIKADSFCTVNSLLLVCKHVAQYGILGIGMTYVIITGGIDLSVGSVVGLVGMIAGGLIQEGLTLKFAGVTLYFSVPAITVICIIIGIIIGIVNGALIAKCKLAPFIVTLGTMYIVPNVTIKGANLHFAINAPLTIPMIIPIMIQITVIAGTLK